MTDRRIRKGIPCLGYESRTAACVAFRDKGMGLSDIAKLTGVTTREVKQLLGAHDDQKQTLRLGPEVLELLRRRNGAT